MIEFSSEIPNHINVFECTGVIYQQYFIPHPFAMFHALQCSFCVSLVFMQALSRDNPYNISMFNYTDDIHRTILSSISVFLRPRDVQGLFSAAFVSLVFSLAWSHDPDTVCHIFDPHKSRWSLLQSCHQNFSCNLGNS